MGTPETDSICTEHPKRTSTYLLELLDLCRKMERERNELRDRQWADGIHSCHTECARPMCVLRRERDEARRDVLDLMEEYENRQQYFGGVWEWDKREDAELIKAICKRLIEWETNQNHE